MPRLRTVAEGNAEISWLVYPFQRNDAGFHIGEPQVVHTLWDDVVTSLREGDPPTKEELLAAFEKPNKRKIRFET